MYRDKDYNDIKNNLSEIQNKAYNDIFNTEIEPNIKEISGIYLIIINFIKKNNRIVYGGFAQNKLILEKDKSKSFYRIQNNVFFNGPDPADIEFYSPDPIMDLKNLTEEIYKLGNTNVEGKEGIHSETYKIFVNFLNYCDITYMPINIYNKLPYINVENIKCAHPHFMLLDAYRIINDPITSYWRLDKSINRFHIILNYYPIEINYNYIDIIVNYNKVLKYIKKNIIHKSNYIVIGLFGYNYYVKKESKNNKINVPYYELITDNFKKNAIYIYDKLIKKFDKSNISTKEYVPFFNLISNKIEYYYKNNLILILYCNNDRCTVYRFSKKHNIFFGTFTLILMYFFFNYYLYLINDNLKINDYFQKSLNKLHDNFLILAKNMIFIRNKYLDNKNITVVNKSPFQDYTAKCIGKPINPIRQSFLKGLSKKKEGKIIKFKYDPSNQNKKLPNFIFKNTSGNQIINKKKFILKKNNLKKKLK